MWRIRSFTTPGNQGSTTPVSSCVNHRGCNVASAVLLGFCACAALTRVGMNPLTVSADHYGNAGSNAIGNGMQHGRHDDGQFGGQQLDMSGRSLGVNGRPIGRTSDVHGNVPDVDMMLLQGSIQGIEAQKVLSLAGQQSVDNVPTALAASYAAIRGSGKVSNSASGNSLHLSYPSWWPYQSFHHAHTMIRPPMPSDPDYVLPVPLAFDNACYIKKKYSPRGSKIAKEKMTSILGEGTFFLVEGWSEFYPTNPESGEKPIDLLGQHERYLLSQLDLPEFQTRCEQFIGASTDATWHSKATDKASIREIVYRHFHELYEARSFGLQYTVAKGLDNLTDMVYKKRKTIPDLKIRILSTFCTPYALDRTTGEVLAFFTTMPDMSRGHFDGEVTLTFPHKEGPKLGNLQSSKSVTYKGNHQPVTYMGNAVTLVVKDALDGRWKYVFETVGHDDATMYTQMGLADEFMATQTAANSLAALGKDHCDLNVGMPVY